MNNVEELKARLKTAYTLIASANKIKSIILDDQDMANVDFSQINTNDWRGPNKIFWLETLPELANAEFSLESPQLVPLAQLIFSVQIRNFAGYSNPLFINNISTIDTAINLIERGDWEALGGSNETFGGPPDINLRTTILDSFQDSATRQLTAALDYLANTSPTTPGFLFTPFSANLMSSTPSSNNDSVGSDG